MDLRNPHLKKAHQVGLFKVGVPEGYLVEISEIFVILEIFNISDIFY